MSAQDPDAGRTSEPRDPTITSEHVAREVRELARRWDEVAERDAPLAARWRKLRASLAACSDNAYAAAREAGAEVVARAPIGLKCAVLATFPHEAAWAETVARELVASKPLPQWSVRVLVSLADPVLASELVSAPRVRAGDRRVVRARDDRVDGRRRSRRAHRDCAARDGDARARPTSARVVAAREERDGDFCGARPRAHRGPRE